MTTNLESIVLFTDEIGVVDGPRGKPQNFLREFFEALQFLGFRHRRDIERGHEILLCEPSL